MTTEQTERLLAALERIATAIEGPSPEVQAEQAREFARTIAHENVMQQARMALARPALTNAIAGPQTVTPRGVQR